MPLARSDRYVALKVPNAVLRVDPTPAVLAKVGLPEGRTIRAEHPTPLDHQGRAYFDEYMAEIVAAIQM